jgi:hypothetical protein
MRLKKDPTAINFNTDRQRVDPFRTIALDDDELERVRALQNETSPESDKLLREILERRGMESLYDSSLKKDRWSGYVMLSGKELWLL